MSKHTGIRRMARVGDVGLVGGWTPISDEWAMVCIELESGEVVGFDMLYDEAWRFAPRLAGRAVTVRDNDGTLVLRLNPAELDCATVETEPFSISLKTNQLQSLRERDGNNGPMPATQKPSWALENYNGPVVTKENA